MSEEAKKQYYRDTLTQEIVTAEVNEEQKTVKLVFHPVGRTREIDLREFSEKRFVKIDDPTVELKEAPAA